VDTWDSSGNETTTDLGLHGLADNRWHHLVVELGGGGDTDVWLDGVEVKDTGFPSYTSTVIDTFEIGGSQDSWDNSHIAIANFAHVAVYNYRLGNNRIASHYHSGADGFPETTGERLNRILTYAGWTGPRALDTGLTQLAGCFTIDGQYAADAFSDIMLWEYGLVFVDSNGVFRFYDRSHRFTSAVTATFSDAAGSNHYQADIAYDYDPTYQYNDVQVTRVGPGSTTGSVQYSGDPSSTIPWLFTSTLTQQLPCLGDAQAQSRAQFLYSLLNQPQVRVRQITLKPSDDPTLWPVALGIEIGDVVQVNRSPRGASGYTISTKVMVAQIKHDVKPDSWTTTLMVLPTSTPSTSADNGAWQLDDPTYSVLGTTTIPVA
jgi:hypothetical protein